MSRLKCVLSDLDDTLVPEMEPERETLLIACGLATERYGTNAELMVAIDGGDGWRSLPQTLGKVEQA